MPLGTLHLPERVREVMTYGLLLGAAFVAYRVNGIYDMDRGQIRAQDDMIVADRVISDMKDAESGQRGYLITGDQFYLKQHIIGLSNLASDLAVFKAYMADYTDEKSTVDQLVRVIAAKTAEMERTVKIYDQDGFPAAQAIVKTNKGLQQTERIRALVETIAARERNRLRKLGSAVF